MGTPFHGFPEQGMAFLRGLEKNNRREWFQPRKEIFDLHLRAPMEHLVEDLNARLARFAPQYITEPKKAIFRIYRDTRFSHDKKPYKTNIAASFRKGGSDKDSAGFYYSVSPKAIEIGGGIYSPGPEPMRAIRTYLLDHHEEFGAILRRPKLRKVMGELWGEPLSRPPKGFPADHPAIDWIRAKHWILFDESSVAPEVALTPKLCSEIATRFELMTPLVEYLNKALAGSKARDPLLGAR